MDIGHFALKRNVALGHFVQNMSIVLYNSRLAMHKSVYLVSGALGFAPF